MTIKLVSAASSFPHIKNKNEAHLSVTRWKQPASKAHQEQSTFSFSAGLFWLLHALRLSSRCNDRALSSPRLLRWRHVDELHFARAAAAPKPTRSFLSDCQGAVILRGIWYVEEPGMVLDTQLNTQRDGIEVWKMAAADCGVFPVHLSSAWWDMIHDFTSIWKTRQATFTRCHQQEVSADKSQCCSFKHGALLIYKLLLLQYDYYRN